LEKLAEFDVVDDVDNLCTCGWVWTDDVDDDIVVAEVVVEDDETTQTTAVVTGSVILATDAVAVVFVSALL